MYLAYGADGYSGGVLLILCAALSYSLYPSAARLAYLHGVDASCLIVLSTVGRAALLSAVAILRGHSLAYLISGVPSSLGAGFLQALQIVSIMMALQYVPGPIMITIVFSHTLMLLFIMYLRKEAIPSALAIASTLVALFGIALVVELFSARASYNVWGILLSFLAALCSANRLYIYGKQVADSAGEVVGAQAFLVASGFILLFPLLDNMSLPRDTAGHLGVLLACCSMMAGQVFFFTGLKRIGAFETSLMLKAEPVFTCLMSWLILGETWPSLSISVSLLL